jgi:threonine/homoserine/homoserine lactone efflux protein
MAVKFAGAAYLLYIGGRALLSRSGQLPGATAGGSDGRWAAFRSGVCPTC